MQTFLPNEGKGRWECSLSGQDEPGLLQLKCMRLPERVRDEMRRAGENLSRAFFLAERLCVLFMYLGFVSVLDDLLDVNLLFQLQCRCSLRSPQTPYPQCNARVESLYCRAEAAFPSLQSDQHLAFAIWTAGSELLK